MEKKIDPRLKKAKKRVKKIKEFYTHLITYILVNLFLIFVWKFSFTLFGNFIITNQFDGDGFIHIPIWLIWGVFLLADAFNTFGFSKSWEERKIQEFMNE